MPYVYKLVHRVTGQFYFGYREANTEPGHIDLPQYQTSSKTVKELGFENFDWSIIGEFDDGGLAYDFEQAMIATHFDDPLILNEQHRHGGQTRFRAYGPQSEEHIRRKANSKRGTKVNEQGRINIGNGSRGRKFSDEARANMSKAFTGLKKSEAHVKKVAEANAKEWLVTCPSGEQTVIKNLAEFCRNNGLTQSLMMHVASGKQKHHKGYVCKRVSYGN